MVSKSWYSLNVFFLFLQFSNTSSYYIFLTVVWRVFPFRIIWRHKNWRFLKFRKLSIFCREIVKYFCREIDSHSPTSSILWCGNELAGRGAVRTQLRQAACYCLCCKCVVRAILVNNLSFPCCVVCVSLQNNLVSEKRYKTKRTVTESSIFSKHVCLNFTISIFQKCSFFIFV